MRRPLRLLPSWLAIASVGSAPVVLLPTPLHAQAGRTEVREGNALYEDGRYQEAHQKYLEGIAAAPGSPVIHFNDGNALYRTEEYQRAMEAYQQAIESGDPGLASAAWYNLGNALYRQQQLEPSLEAYKQTLRLSPDDTDAKHNLERVIQELQQQQQQQRQDQQGQQDQQADEEQQGGQRREPPSGDQQGQPQEPEDREAEGRPERLPGQVTPEEARRLLEALQEDPQDVERGRAAATGPRPRRPW